MKSIVLRFIAFLVAVSIAHSVSFAGFEDRRYEVLRLAIAVDVEKELIASGVCTDSIDCRRKGALFVSPTSGGVAVQIWGIEDDKGVMTAISACGRYFIENDNLMKLSIKVYSVRKEDSLKDPFWVRESPVIEVNFKR